MKVMKGYATCPADLKIIGGVVTITVGQASRRLGSVRRSIAQIQLNTVENGKGTVGSEGKVSHSIFDFRNSFCVLRSVPSL